jgi:hypothetical protein
MYIQYEFPILKEHFDKSIVEVCSVGNAMRLHDVAVLHDLKEASKGILDFIAKQVYNIYNYLFVGFKDSV